MLTVFIRAALLYLLIIFSLRLMGKRQLGELQPSELVITILISNIASVPIEDPATPMVLGIVPVLVLVGFELIVSNLSLRFRPFRKLLSGNAMVVIKDGKIDQKALHDLRFSIDDLMESLREQGIFSVEDVYFAIVETTGKISVLERHRAQTVTSAMLHVKGKDENPPILLISDGKLLEDSLQRYQIKREWVENILTKEKRSLAEIFLMTANETGSYYIVPKEEESR